MGGCVIAQQGSDIGRPMPPATSGADQMHEFVSLAMKSHGGLGRWPKLQGVSARCEWALKGKGVMDELHVTADLRREWTSPRFFRSTSAKSGLNSGECEQTHKR
jgi:hypothetical protein